MGITPFKNGRMFVGWRLRDWKLVYYAPYTGGDADENDSSLTPSLYFTSPTGDEEGLMMEGEVAFLPHFSHECCEAKSKPERRAMQMRNLIDAHKLYNEKDHSSFAELMEEMEDPAWRRWNSIMSDIKAFRNPKIKARKSKDAKKKAKEAQAAAFAEAGVPEDDIDGNLTSDSDDSGFEDDDDNEVRLVSRRKRAPMAPPPKRSHGSGNNDSDPRKKRKPAARPRQDSEELQMSGVLSGDSDNARARLSRRGSLGGMLSGRESLDYDPRPPEDNFSPGNRDQNSGLFMTPDATSERPSATHRNIERLQNLGGHTRTYEETMNAINGTFDEDAALAAAMRASREPDDRADGADGDFPDLARVLHETTQQSRDRPEADVTESIEDQNGVNGGETRAVRNSASSRSGRSRDGSRRGSG